MFGFLFRKNKIFDRKRPDFYEGIVTKKEYSQILELSEKECQRIGKTISIQAGTIKVANPEKTEEEFSFHLDNLVRKCKYYGAAEWEHIVKEHFSRFPIDQSKANFFAKDFEYAQPLLKLLVRSPNSMSEQMIQRLDFPNTASFLILDYDERFHFLTEDAIKEWDIPKKELFEIALENIALEKIDIQEVVWADKFELFSFFSGDFSASFLVALTKNAPFAIGKFGAVVAIPTKGSAFVHPLNGATALPFINSFDETFSTFYHQDEVPISQSYYWYYEGEFEVFQEKKSNQNSYIEMPLKLNNLLKINNLQ